jgi:flagellar motility protein MotE (MotC chaperone)
MYNEFPEEYLEEIGVPGKFVKKIKRRVHLKDGTDGVMDSAFILDPDNEILLERVAACVEHISIPIGDMKLFKLGDYDIQLVVNEHLPTFIVIASHLPRDKSKNTLIRSPSDITQPYFLDLSPENICERLNTLKKRIDNNQCLSVKNTLNLGIVLLYAPRKHATSITKEVAELYLKIVDDLDEKMEYCLYSVITILADAYFENEIEYQEVITMIDQKTSAQSKMNLASHEAVLEDLKYAKEDRTKLEGQLDETKYNLTKANGNIAKLNGELDKTKNDLTKANGQIENLKAEVEKLKHELNSK